MPRHPTVQVPNIGPMDHAWDLLGEWQAEFELPETESPVHGKVTFRSWTDAELAPGARERDSSDGCRWWSPAVGSPCAIHQLVAPGDSVAGLAPLIRARCR
jgi:hypothetical protein